MSRYTETEIFAHLDELRERRAQLVDDEQAILAEIKEWVRIGGQIRVNGEPINRSLLIERAGLSSRTAYRIFDVLPD